MAKQGKGVVKNGKASVEKSGRSLRIIDDIGLVTEAEQLAHLMSAVISDSVTGAMPPPVGNVTCNAAGKLIKLAELRYKYGGKDGSAFKLIAARK